MLWVFLSYFFFHGLFFACFSLQSYWFYEHNQYEFCFIVLIVFYTKFIVRDILQLRNQSVMRRMGKWLKGRLYLRIVEHTLLAVTMALIPFYMQEEPQVWIPGWLLLIPTSAQCLLNLFFVKYDKTPCNATYQLTLKTVLVLRFLVGVNILIKWEAKLDWDWSTAFWPYWCSFTIQAVLIIATIVIFFNTVSLFFKSEAKFHDGKY